MMLKTLTKKQITEMNAIRWWHRIAVGFDAEGTIIYTPGEVAHGPSSGDWPTTRFGLPEDLTGRTVLDVGGWDGFFSFEAEERGASLVHSVDIPAGDGGNWGGTDGFEFAKRLLGSEVRCSALDLDSDTPKSFCATGYDVVLCYGVLYHVKNPLRCIENLFLLTKPGGLCLIETARDPDDTLKNYAAWCLLPGRHDDPTNFWYPSEGGLRTALEVAGFTLIETHYDDGQRMTVRAYRPMPAADKKSTEDKKSTTDKTGG